MKSHKWYLACSITWKKCPCCDDDFPEPGACKIATGVRVLEEYWRDFCRNHGPELRAFWKPDKLRPGRGSRRPGAASSRRVKRTIIRSLGARQKASIWEEEKSGIMATLWEYLGGAWWSAIRRQQLMTMQGVWYGMVFVYLLIILILIVLLFLVKVYNP